MARVIRSKGVLDAVSAVSAANASGVHVADLTIFGPPDEDMVQFIDGKEFAGGAAVYGGVLSGHQVVQTLRLYDVMLFPTYYEGEGFPGSLIDAFQAGLPVIATDWAYNDEIIHAGIDGFLVHPRDIEGISKILCTLFWDRALLSRLSRAGQSRSHDFDSLNVVARLVQLISFMTPEKRVAWGRQGQSVKRNSHVPQRKSMS